MRVKLYESRPLTRAATLRRRTRPLPANPPARLLLLLAAFCCLAFPAPRARGQAKPNIAGEVEARKKGSATPKPSPEGRQGQRRRQTNATRPAPTTPAAVPLDVTFYTGLADADVFVNAGQANMQRLGRSGADGRLVARLPRGTYVVTASRPGSRIERRQIDVRAGSTSFVLDLRAPANSPFGSNVASPTTAGDVFKRYLDPKQTDRVTASEWQLAQAETAAAFAANPLDPQTEAQALFARGQVAYLRAEYARAIADFNAAAIRLPSSALAYYGLGNAYLGLNRLGEAARAYERAAELSPQLSMAYKGSGDVLARQNKNREALRYYERARVLGYTSLATRQVTARILLKERRWADALRELTEVSKAAPSAEVFVGIGDAYVGLGQALSAAPAYRRALELDPKSAQAHYKFGELAYAQREFAAAAESLERALALDPAGALIDRGRARDLANKAAAKARAAR